MKEKNIVLFGPPGSGKGTQAERLKKILQWMHIDTGAIFRNNIQLKTPLGNLAKSYINKGNLVPDVITIGMIKAEVEKNKNVKGFIFDGFPRTVAQAKALDAFLQEKNMKINAMIALEVPEDILIKRILERGKISGRTDDQEESKIRNRFKEYHTKTSILKKYYQEKQKYYKIDGTATIEDITNFITNVVAHL